MSRLGFIKRVVVYDGEACLGELDSVAVKDESFQFPNNEIRIHHISPNSERCHPLSVLQTISGSPVRCKLEPPSSIPTSDQSQLINLHASCFYELKVTPSYHVFLRYLPHSYHLYLISYLCFCTGEILTVSNVSTCHIVVLVIILAKIIDVLIVEEKTR